MAVVPGLLYSAAMAISIFLLASFGDLQLGDNRSLNVFEVSQVISHVRDWGNERDWHLRLEAIVGHERRSASRYM
jgi:hypothetical protein